jgi:hypothetical protein
VLAYLKQIEPACASARAGAVGPRHAAAYPCRNCQTPVLPSPVPEETAEHQQSRTILQQGHRSGAWLSSVSFDH